MFVRVRVRPFSIRPHQPSALHAVMCAQFAIAGPARSVDIYEECDVEENLGTPPTTLHLSRQPPRSYNVALLHVVTALLSGVDLDDYQRIQHRRCVASLRGH